MVTNTAGTTTTETSTAKENGECEKDDAANNEYSNLKQNSTDSSKATPTDKVVTAQQNESSSIISNSQSEITESPNYSQPTTSNGMSSNANYSGRPYGNGVPTTTPVTMNGPPQSPANVAFPAYGSYNHSSNFSPKPGPRPMQNTPTGSNYPPSMQQRYPANQQSGATPTLNQLLTTPSRYPATVQHQYPSYSSHPTSQQQQAEYGGQAHPQMWQTRPQQYTRGPSDQQIKTEIPAYPPPLQQQQYPPPPPVGYHPNHGRYPAPANTGQGAYNQTQQYNSGMPPPGSSGYPSATPSPSRHPSYSSYPNYNQPQQPPYYAARPPQPQGYPPPSNPNQPMTQDAPPQNAPASQVQDTMQQQQPKDHMMSPTRTPQPTPTPAPAPSPMNAAPTSQQVHPGYPSVAQLRGPSPAPSSPASAGQPRSTPLSPPAVRPGTPQQQQIPMRPASEQSDHGSIPGHSPMPAPNYSNYRAHPTQQSFGNQPPGYPQNMMSPQHQPSYPGNQQHPAPPQHQGAPPMRPAGPPSVGKPSHQMHGTPSQQNYGQSLPSYQQPGSHIPYYDSASQHHPMMPGYNSSSPAPPPPTERRPSRQGSQPSAAQLPDPAGRQGAAAAAAAAMAAAAHSAQPGSQAAQRPQTPSYFPPQQQQPQPQQQQQQQQQQPQPRTPHPNYNAMPQSNEMYQQNMSYPRMPHPGTSNAGPPHQMMGPPTMGGPSPQGMHPRMHPPNHYQSGYPQSSGPPQGHYPGYYPPNTGDPHHPPGMRPRFPSSGYEQSPLAQEDTKKPAARSASQKLAALFEPADEPGRREFIERILRYWEEKDLPLKNAPLMGRKTLDLFRLFQTVGEKGGMQEVTNAKKWTDISSRMGLGTASTSGFTLKKQYCKYLYGFECRERGEIEPQEALARVTEANRKRKQAQESLKDDKLSSMQLQSSHSMHPQHPGQPYPSQQYPHSGQYPHPMGQQYRHPTPSGSHSYMMSQTSGPPPHHMSSYSQHQGPNSGMGPPPGSQQPLSNYPSGSEPNSMHPGSRMPTPSIPSSGYPVQPTPIPAPSPAAAERSMEAPKMNTSEAVAKLVEQSAIPNAAVLDSKQSIKPPVPSNTSLAAANPFSDPMASQYSSPVPEARTPQQQYPPRPLQGEPYRPNYPQRPGMHPNHYPYSNSPHPRPPTGPNHPGQSASPRTSSGYPPTTPLSTRPMPRPARGQYPMQSSSYASTMSGPYSGMKRPASDTFGPPSKYTRPDGNQSFSPSDPMMRPRYPAGAGAPPHSVPPSHTQVSSSHSYQPNRKGTAPSPYSKLEPSPRSTTRWGLPSMPRTHSPAPMSIQKFQQDPRSKRPLQMPPRAPYIQYKRDVSLFPPNSVEATAPRFTKFRRKTCQDVGMLEAWRLVMALKSGLLVESTWALNSLTIFLYDQHSVAQLRLSQLPGLLDALVEHYRRYLAELFMLPKEREMLGVDLNVEVAEENDDTEGFETEKLSVVSKTKSKGRKKKGCSANSKLASKYSSLPVKVEPRNDPFIKDNSDRWDFAKTVNLLDDLSHIVLSFTRSVQPTVVPKETTPDDAQSVAVVEATLEDVLSIPCSVISPDAYGLLKTPTEDFDIEVRKISSEHTLNEKTENENKNTLTLDHIVVKTEKWEEKEKANGAKESTISQEDSNSRDSAQHDESKAEHPSENDIKNEKTKPIDDEHPVENTACSENESPEDGSDASKPCSVNGDIPSPITQRENGDCKKPKDKALVTPKSTDNEVSPLCNGLQVNFAKTETKDCKKSDIKIKTESKNEAEDAPSVKVEVKCELGKGDHPADDNMAPAAEAHLEESSKKSEVDTATNKLEEDLSIVKKVQQVLKERNVVLLEDEAAGREGSCADVLSGPLLSSKYASRRSELSHRVQCLSNIIRGLSFIPSNTTDLIKHRDLMRALSGTLLLRHKHRTRKRRSPTSVDDLIDGDSSDYGESQDKPPTELEARVKVESCQQDKELAAKTAKVKKPNCVADSSRKKSASTRSSDLFAPEVKKVNADPGRKRGLFSSTVLDDDDDDNDFVYTDPWWWDTVRRIREDSLITLANISPTLDLSIISDDHVPILVLEACLHLSVCSSSEASDAFSLKARNVLSAQRLALEILTKLSIKDQNVDLILATRPFSRVEKLFAYLVALVCDRKDQILREFAIVLLSNLSTGDHAAARAIALQNGSISGLITFLEECEETGLSNSKLFRQQSINCGTTVFMMVKAAKTLLSMASVTENKPSFAKHQLRLLSLSMSQLLGSRVTSIVSSLLYELSNESAT